MHPSLVGGRSKGAEQVGLRVWRKTAREVPSHRKMTRVGGWTGALGVDDSSTNVLATVPS